MTGEHEVLEDLLLQLERIGSGSTEDLEVMDKPPATVADMVGMSAVARAASKAVLKDFEQFVDTLQRIIRTELRATGYRLKGLTPFDVANKAEELEQVEDGRRFYELIKLRNELAHEYPDDPEARWVRLINAVGAFPFLNDAAGRVRQFAANRLPEPNK